MAIHTYREVINQWITQFTNDEDQISLDFDQIEDNFLRLSCGDGRIVFSFGNSNKISIAAEGDDRFVNILVRNCKDAIQKLDLCTSTDEKNVSPAELKNVLLKFSEISKIMAANAHDRY